jgi:tripartite-type tricarboxylate transporter receptor subunit TctC
MSGLIAGRRGAFAAFASVLTFVCALSARADDKYPSRPIRLVVGFGAGGPTDIPARFIADKVGAALGQTVVVENKPAAGGIVATRDVLAQPRDGYTLLLCTHFDATNTAVYRDAGYRLSDIAPISLIAKYYYGLALANAVPANDFESFVAYAKAHPGEVTYATVGAASAQEIMARQLQKLTGVEMNRIPFRGGAGVVEELVAGRVDLYPSPTLAIMPQYRAKQLKIIATTSPERLKTLPEVSTLKEKGFDFVRFGWLGVCAGAGTPEPIIKTLNEHIVSIVATPQYHALIENAGSIAISSTPQELGAIISKTEEDVAPAVKEFGLQQD